MMLFESDVCEVILACKNISRLNFAYLAWLYGRNFEPRIVDHFLLQGAINIIQ